MKVKVRLAPSPTGFLHIGTAQSALYNWLFTRKNGGEFCLRIEDTDRERSTKEYEQSILDALEWLGLKWDGGIIRQSERMDKYRTSLEKLLADGKAFYCHHTKEELEAGRKEQEEKKEAPIHVCSHKNETKGKQPGGIIRLAVGNKTISFNDKIRGEIKFESSLLGDFSIAKSLDEPLYNLAVVVDDADMEITHVIRGEDHISNTPKQILIYDALGLAVPKFAHLPLILASDRSKLSKRNLLKEDGYSLLTEAGGKIVLEQSPATAVVDFKEDYLPETILNFIGGLSYTFSKEIMTKEEMIEEFELSKVHKSGAVFDLKKLNWLNSQYVKKLSPEEFRKASGIPEIPNAAVPLITERLEKLSDAHNFDYFWKESEYDKGLLKWKKADLNKSIETLTEVKKIVEEFDFKKEKDELRKVLDELSAKVGDRGLVYWPLRVALTGKEKSPDPVDIAFVIGKKRVLERIDKSVKLLK